MAHQLHFTCFEPYHSKEVENIIDSMPDLVQRRLRPKLADPGASRVVLSGEKREYD